MNGRKNGLATLAIAAGLVLAAFLAFVLLLWWQQERIVFQPTGPPYPDHGPTRRVSYHASDGQELFAFVVTGDTVARRALIAFHGNADLAVRLTDWAEEVSRRTGETVVLPEYRGYGGLKGVPSVAGTRRDASAALAMTRDSLGIASSDLAFYGHSLGSAIATELAMESKPRFLILESPFTSARDMARIVIVRPLDFVWKFISRVDYDTEREVRSLDAPVWVAHGARDVIIPARMGRAVHAAAKMKGELLIVEDAGHNDIAEMGGEGYWRWLQHALRP